MAGGCVHGGGLCIAGGVHGGGHAWQGGMPGGGAWQIPRDTVNVAGGTHPTRMHSCLIHPFV